MSYIILLSMFLVVQLVMPLWVLESGGVFQAYLYGILYGAFNAPLWMITWSMIPDCIEVDEFKTGERREGMYFGILSFVQKLSVALAIAVSGIILQKIGYIPGTTEQTAAVLDNLKTVYAFLPAVFILISIILIALNPMSRDRHAALLEILSKKRAGEEYDETPIRKLL
jgi:Na+/melibiose symporter-like transporter